MFIEWLMEENKFAVAFTIAKVLLDAPISQGGVSTDEIKQAMKTDDWVIYIIMDEKIELSGETEEHIRKLVNRYMRMRLKRNFRKVYKTLIPIK